MSLEDKTTALGLVNWAYYRGRHRMLIIMAPNREHTAYTQVAQSLEGQDATLKDYDLRVVELFNDHNGTMEGTPLSPVATQGARKYFRLDNEPEDTFLMLLVGKDGQVKHQASEAVPLSALYEMIDAMPGRQAEVHNRSSDE